MKLQDIFRDNINRSIETVIKADDRQHIWQEVSEYVVTNEINNKLANFFDEYLDYQGVNGVWISGFFGSGKSHLLKILSYLLENEAYNSMHLGDVFCQKIEDAMLKANVSKAIKIPSKSVLFNIDQKADITNKQQPDAILSVFNKVFNEMLGYYPKQGYIANFERDLDNRGLYATFKNHYLEIASKEWETGREEYSFEEENIALALEKTGVMSYDKGLNILDKFERDYKLSIDEFVENVKKYIESQPKGFRLNFFVDEVGQYISENTKLMLNLQTIAETLASKTNGQSWILVTSQEDIDTVVGNLTDRQQNDFSRIQARFQIKINLTSANVDEVIQKRLLCKKPEITGSLHQLYEKEKNNINTLFKFGDGSVQFKSFADQDQFGASYPFLPYHFDLFQQSIRGLSLHSAFQGKHSSVGERSMLGVFQLVLQKLENRNIDVVVPFDMLFEGIRSTIRGENQAAITLAEKNLDNEFAIRVLKALFLVKYYRQFKASERNLSILLMDSLELNLENHNKKVKEALNTLEYQTYIQRNGDLFEFLTDDEKDIEKEIKNTEIDPGETTRFIADVLFDDVIRDSKIKYLENKQDYEFARKIDNNLIGREKEITINIVTPDWEYFNQETIYRATTMGKAELLFVLPPDDRLIQDVRLHKKTEKYILQNTKTSNKDTVTRLIAEKGTQNAERRRTLIKRLDELLGKSRIYLNGDVVEIGASANARNRVISAAQELVRFAFPNLKMIKTAFTEESVRGILTSKQDDLFKGDDASISEAELEMFNYVNRQVKSAERVTIQSILEKFKSRPYGWYQAATLSVAAKLIIRGKIELKQDSNPLNDTREILNALSNNRMYNNTLIEPQVEFSKQEVNKLRDLFQEFLDAPSFGKEAKDIALEFKQKLAEEHIMLKNLFNERNNYPFLKSLEKILNDIGKLSEKDYIYLIQNIKTIEDTLLDAKEELIDPVKKFMNGDQRTIFDKVNIFVEGHNANFDYVEGDELKILKSIRQHESPYSGSLMRDAKSALDALQDKVLARIKLEKEIAVEKIQQVIKEVEQHYEFNTLKPEQQQKIRQPFQEAINRVNDPDQRYIANIRIAVDRCRNELFNAQLENILRFCEENKPKTNASEPEPEKPHITFVRKNSIVVDFTKSVLETEADVDDYTKALGRKMKQLINENKRISL